MNIITIDNKHYIPARVVMISTDEESCVQITKNVLKYTDKLFCRNQADMPEAGFINPNQNQHLYLVCDLPIEEGDWIYHPNTGIVKVLEIEKLIDYSNYRFETSDERNWICDLTNDCRKVIATTDSSLKYGEDIPTIIRYKSLPQFPQPFIKEFVERQGKDVDVLVEVVDNTDYDGFSEQEVFYVIPDWQIKLNPDNTVNLIFK